MQDAFRQRLLNRLLAATGAGSVGLGLAAACGGQDLSSVKVVDTGRDASTSGSGGAAGAGGRNGAGGTAGASGEGGTGMGGVPTPSFGGGGVQPPPQPELPVSTVCLSPSADAAASAGCGGGAEAAKQALEARERELCQSGDLIVQDVFSAASEGGACCFTVRYRCYVYVGRAFLVDEGLLKADVKPNDGWLTGGAPDVSALTLETRRALCDAWIKDALFEHASVATFSRFAMQLLAVGAPSRLLHETLAAGKDEIRHAELCFGLASAYAGQALGPDRFPIGEGVPVTNDLVAIIEETIVEGCIGETIAAYQAAVQAERARDPAVVAALASTIDDETRHAELAWRVVAWALQAFGEPVRRAALRTFAEFQPPEAPVLDLAGVDLLAFEAHGRLLPEDARRVGIEALERIVRPCAAALLGVDVRGFRPATALFGA